MVGALGPCGDGPLGPCGGLKGCQRLYCPWLMSCLWFDCNQFSKKHHLYDCLVHCGWPFKIVFLFVVYCFLVLFICVSRLCSIAVHAPAGLAFRSGGPGEEGTIRYAVTVAATSVRERFTCIIDANVVAHTFSDQCFSVQCCIVLLHVSSIQNLIL